MAAREDTLLKLIASAYRAAVEPEAWVDFLTQYADATGGENAVLHWFDKRTTSLVCSVNTGLRNEGLRDYAEYYCKHDPRVHFAFTHPPGTVFVDYNFTTESDMNRSAYYSDFLRGEGLRYCVAVVTLDDATQHCGIAAHRTARQGHFDAPDVNLTQVLMPHLRRAIQLQDRLRAADARMNSLSAALDRLTMGAIFVDARARPLLMNRAAKEIVRKGDGLRSTKDGLEAARLTDTVRLRQAIFDAARTNAGEVTSPGAAMRLPRPSARRPLEVLVSPLPGAHRRSDPFESSVVVFVSDPELMPHAVKDLLVQVHGLTRAEAELAEALLAGMTLDDFAEQTGRRIYTVRKTLQHVFAKTDTSRQSELVRLLLGGLATLQGPPADGK